MEKKNKLDIIKQVVDILSDQVKSLEKSLMNTNESINDAPGAMVSHSDTTRSQLTSVVNAAGNSFSEKLEGLKMLTRFLTVDLSEVVFEKVKQGCIVVIQKDDTTEHYLILPAGSGIKLKFNDDLITCLTPNSPLGKLIIGKKIGDTFNIINSKDGKKATIKDLF